MICTVEQIVDHENLYYGPQEVKISLHLRLAAGNACPFKNLFSRALSDFICICFYYETLLRTNGSMTFRASQALKQLSKIIKFPVIKDLVRM